MDRNERVEAIRDRADAGDSRAMSTLGALAYAEGDVGAARRWWEQALGAGHTDAMTNLGILAYEEGDVAGARRWYEQAAAGGDTDAMVNLGRLAEGRRDVADAGRWYQQAADAGDAGAETELGRLAETANTRYERIDDPTVFDNQTEEVVFEVDEEAQESIQRILAEIDEREAGKIDQDG